MAPPTKSGFYVQSIIYAVSGTAITGGAATQLLAGQDTQNYLSLYNNSLSDYTGILNTGATTTGIAWANTDEVTGTGWVTGGVQLSVAAAGGPVGTAVTLTGSGPFVMTYTWATNPLSITGTTLTGVYGCIIYNHSATSPVTKPMILQLCFGTAYNTVAGTFGITPSGTGLAALTLTA
jgi:hypothetical protein